MITILNEKITYICALGRKLRRAIGAGLDHFQYNMRERHAAHFGVVLAAGADVCLRAARLKLKHGVASGRT